MLTYLMRSRCLQYLTCLELVRMEVSLPALQPIAAQLQTLCLKKCLLCNPQQQPTDFFAAGWDRLELLDMTGASIDRDVGVVRMPLLRELRVGAFTFPEPLTNKKLPYALILQPFSEGAPGCTRLECQLNARTGILGAGAAPSSVLNPSSSLRNAHTWTSTSHSSWACRAA